MKKIFALILLFSSFTVFADAISELQSANFLARKGFIEDMSTDPNKYELGNFIKRKEMMKIVMKISELEIKPVCENMFSDVQNDWSCKYIESAAKNDFIAKVPNFRPDDNITKIEALKLIFKANGIEKSGKVTDWKEDYISTAISKTIISAENSNYDEPATRGRIFETSKRGYQYKILKKELETPIFSNEK